MVTLADLANDEMDGVHIRSIIEWQWIGRDSRWSHSYEHALEGPNPDSWSGTRPE